MTVGAVGIAHQREGHCTHGTADRADKAATGGLAGSRWVAAGDGPGGQVLAILVQVEGFFVDADFLVWRGDEADVMNIDGDGGGAFITIGVAHGVGENIGRARGADGVRVAVIDGVAIGVQGQVAVGAVDLGVQAANRRGRGVVACTHTDHGTTRGRPIGAAFVVVQDVATDRPALIHRGGIRMSGRQVINDVHVQVAVGGGAVVVGDDDRKLLAEAVGAVGGWMGFVIQQGVAVADHPSRSVETGDGQGVAQRGSNRLRETRCHATRDDVDAANAQGLHTVQRGDGKGAALSQRRCIRAAAVAEIFLLQ
ncbi:hypothetical protein D3C76_987210 [compost metagenome]